jgi:hypothetical protein
MVTEDNSVGVGQFIDDVEQMRNPALLPVQGSQEDILDQPVDSMGQSHLTVLYPAKFSIRVKGAISAAPVSTNSHPCTRKANETYEECVGLVLNIKALVTVAA